jgi:hypothetical protein
MTNVGPINSECTNSVPPNLDHLTFVPKYVPSRARYPFSGRSSASLKNGEDEMYDSLVGTFLDAVVAG